MRVGFTGTQEGMTQDQRVAVFDECDDLWPDEVDHGLCVGADEQFHDLVDANLNAVINGHPPSNRSKMSERVCDVLHPPKPYLKRNHDIVDASDRLIAAPRLMCEEQRSGTWSTVRYARTLRRPIAVCWPDGSVTRENWPTA
jgi:hypothetical protein